MAARHERQRKRPRGCHDQGIERIAGESQFVREKHLRRRQVERMIGGAAEEIVEEPLNRPSARARIETSEPDAVADAEGALLRAALAIAAVAAAGVRARWRFGRALLA